MAVSSAAATVLPPTIAVGSGPYGVSSDGTHVWVVNTNGDSVSEIVASSGTVIHTISVGSGPLGVSSDGTHAWVANLYAGTVSEINASNGTVAKTISVGNGPYGVSSDGTHVWVTNTSDGTVSEIAASSGAVIHTIPVGSQPYGVSSDGTHVWVANYGGGTVSEIAASSGTVINNIPGSQPYGVSSDGTHVWVTNLANTVREIDASSGTVIHTIRVGSGSDFVSSDGVHVWVADAFTDSVNELKASSGTVINTIPVGSAPYGVSSDGTHVWVTNNGDNTVSEIDASTTIGCNAKLANEVGKKLEKRSSSGEANTIVEENRPCFVLENWDKVLFQHLGAYQTAQVLYGSNSLESSFQYTAKILTSGLARVVDHALPGSFDDQFWGDVVGAWTNFAGGQSVQTVAWLDESQFTAGFLREAGAHLLLPNSLCAVEGGSGFGFSAEECGAQVLRAIASNPRGAQLFVEEAAANPGLQSSTQLQNLLELGHYDHSWGFEWLPAFATVLETAACPSYNSNCPGSEGTGAEPKGASGAAHSIYETVSNLVGSSHSGVNNISDTTSNGIAQVVNERVFQDFPEPKAAQDAQWQTRTVRVLAAAYKTDQGVERVLGAVQRYRDAVWQSSITGILTNNKVATATQQSVSHVAQLVSYFGATLQVSEEKHLADAKANVNYLWSGISLLPLGDAAAFLSVLVPGVQDAFLEWSTKNFSDLGTKFEVDVKEAADNNLLSFLFDYATELFNPNHPGPYNDAHAGSEILDGFASAATSCGVAPCSAFYNPRNPTQAETTIQRLLGAFERELGKWSNRKTIN